jgi:hypothetical protein
MDALDALEQIYDLLVRYGRPDLHLVVTVSPVPFQATFTEQDVLVANTYSKSTLHAVAQDFARSHANVDYLPSFECVTNSDRRLAWEEDRIHVTDTLVRANILAFIRAYSGEPSRAAEAEAALQSLLDSVGHSSLSTSPESELPDFLTASDARVFPAGVPKITASSSLSPALGPGNLGRRRRSAMARAESRMLPRMASTGLSGATDESGALATVPGSIPGTRPSRPGSAGRGSAGRRVEGPPSSGVG